MKRCRALLRCVCQGRRNKPSAQRTARIRLQWFCLTRLGMPRAGLCFRAASSVFSDLCCPIPNPTMSEESSCLVLAEPHGSCALSAASQWFPSQACTVIIQLYPMPFVYTVRSDFCEHLPTCGSAAIVRIQYPNMEKRVRLAAFTRISARKKSNI